MYVDMEDKLNNAHTIREQDKAKNIRQNWLWKTQFQREATKKQILCFFFGFGVGFASCTILIAMLENTSWIAS